MIDTLLSIRRLPVLRRETLWSYIRTFAGHQDRPDCGSVTIAGRRIKYLTFNSLRYMFREIFINQEYHFTTTNERPLIIDGGSNIGLSVLYFNLLYPGATIIAFEPYKPAYDCLIANISLNGWDNVTPYMLALGAQRTSQAILYHNPTNRGDLTVSTTVGRMPRGETAWVDIVNLSDFVVGSRVDLLKLDIEGAEFDVLYDFFRRGNAHLIDQLVVEYHHHIGGRNDLGAFLTLLEDRGFTYQIGAYMNRPFRSEYQDVLIYARPYQVTTEYPIRLTKLPRYVLAEARALHPNTNIVEYQEFSDGCSVIRFCNGAESWGGPLHAPHYHFQPHDDPVRFWQRQ